MHQTIHTHQRRQTQHSPQTWIFQANPKKYQIMESLRAEKEELWNLNQHVRDVQVGDRVLIWVCGAEAGIYAIGTILTAPEIKSDSPVGIAYWLPPKEGKKPKARVLVRYDHVLLDRPLSKLYLKADPDLASLSILKSPRGTNFKVTEDQWAAIEQWLNDM